MTTELRKAITRKTAAPNRRGRRFVITLTPGDTIGVREERTRKTFYISIALVYALAVKYTVDAERAQKKARRKRGDSHG